jgi:hypothetical protein
MEAVLQHGGCSATMAPSKPQSVPMCLLTVHSAYLVSTHCVYPFSLLCTPLVVCLSTCMLLHSACTLQLYVSILSPARHLTHVSMYALILLTTSYHYLFYCFCHPTILFTLCYLSISLFPSLLSVLSCLSSKAFERLASLASLAYCDCLYMLSSVS